MDDVFYRRTAAPDRVTLSRAAGGAACLFWFTRAADSRTQDEKRVKPWQRTRVSNPIQRLHARPRERISRSRIRISGAPKPRSGTRSTTIRSNIQRVELA